MKVCDVKEDGFGWGKVLRLCIEMDVHKPLSQDRTIKCQGNRSWMLIKYEKLTKICFRCGKITHGRGACVVEQTGIIRKVRAKVDRRYEKSKNTYGPSSSSSTEHTTTSRVKQRSPASLSVAEDPTSMGLGGKPKSPLKNLGEM